MSNPSWSNVPNPFTLAVFNGIMYAAGGYGSSYISKINISDGSIVSPNPWANISRNPNGLVIDSTGTYMYAANYNGTITKINMSNGTIVNASWATTGVPNQYLTIDSTGTYMYVTNWDYASLGTITQIQMSDGSIVNASYVTGLDGPLGIIINKNSTI